MVDRSNVVEGRTTDVTEPEWSGEVVEYNVEYRGMILSDRSIAVVIHVHDTTKQELSLHYIVHGRSKKLIAREPSRVVAHHTGSAYLWVSVPFPHDLLERG